MNRKHMTVLLIVLMLLLGGCSSTAEVGTKESADEATEELRLTLEELKDFDGQDGSPAYIAVEGIIYEVTEVSAWNSGTHNGFSAGKDISGAIKDESPHGIGVLENLQVIGTIVE